MVRITLFFIITLISANALVTAQPFGYTPLQIQSLFSEDYRNEQYENALKYGRWLVNAHPKEMENYPGNYRGDRNFSRMINIYEHIASQQQDPALREAYLDSSLQLYDRVFALFTEDEIDVFRWYFDRGRFYQTNADYISDANQNAVDDYRTMFEMDPQRAIEAGNGYYVQLLVQHYSRTGERDMVFSTINSAEPYANENLQGFFDQTRNELITDPEERIELLTENLEENPDDLEIIEELYELYNATGNRAMSSEMANKLYEIDPNIDNIMRLADRAENNGNYTEANRYLREAHALQGNREKARTSLRIANNHLNIRNLQNARQFARQAASEDSGWGDPFITIAQIYGQAVSQCAGSDLSRIDKAVYWLVLDYLDRARERNSGVANTVNRLYRTYEPVTPNAEEKFYQSWNTGESIRIDGSLKECYSWISESTTIR
ncbi:MAG: hypothetical protein WD097_04190 [Balneolales bacterium]